MSKFADIKDKFLRHSFLHWLGTMWQESLALIVCIYVFLNTGDGLRATIDPTAGDIAPDTLQFVTLAFAVAAACIFFGFLFIRISLGFVNDYIDGRNKNNEGETISLYREFFKISPAVRVTLSVLAIIAGAFLPLIAFAIVFR